MLEIKSIIFFVLFIKNKNIIESNIDSISITICYEKFTKRKVVKSEKDN